MEVIAIHLSFLFYPKNYFNTCNRKCAFRCNKQVLKNKRLWKFNSYLCILYVDNLIYKLMFQYGKLKMDQFKK
jgi:hypothetical protein